MKTERLFNADMQMTQALNPGCLLFTKITSLTLIWLNIFLMMHQAAMNNLAFCLQSLRALCPKVEVMAREPLLAGC
jgi:hypothetical protein